MNDQELRDHLRTTLEPVTAARPSVSSLRATAARRTRRNRLAAGALGVAVLAGAGTGIGLAAGGSGSTARVEPAAVAPAPAVHVPCTTGSVSLTVGQTLVVDPCADQGTATLGARFRGTSVLGLRSGQTFRAVDVGSADIDIENTGCRAPTGFACSLAIHSYGSIHVVVSSSQPSTGAVTSVACTPPTATSPSTPDAVEALLQVGDTLVLQDCPAGTLAVSVSDPSVVRENPVVQTYPTPPPTFTALEPGTATLVVSVQADSHCPVGAACPVAGREVGTIAVVVTDPTAAPSSAGLGGVAGVESPGPDPNR